MELFSDLGIIWNLCMDLDIKRKDHRIPQVLMNLHKGPGGITCLDKFSHSSKFRPGVRSFGFEIDGDKHFDMWGDVQAIDALVHPIESKINEGNLSKRELVTEIFCMQQLLRNEDFNNKMLQFIRCAGKNHPYRYILQQWGTLEYVEDHTATELICMKYRECLTSMLEHFTYFQIVETQKPTWILGDCFGVHHNHDVIYLTCSPYKLGILSAHPITPELLDINPWSLNQEIYDQSERFVVHHPEVFLL